jgi:hypothetical protein
MISVLACDDFSVMLCYAEWNIGGWSALAFRAVKSLPVSDLLSTFNASNVYIHVSTASFDKEPERAL